MTQHSAETVVRISEARRAQEAATARLRPGMVLLLEDGSEVEHLEHGLVHIPYEERKALSKLGRNAERAVKRDPDWVSSHRIDSVREAVGR
jgi:hypothetical protein